MPRGGSTQESIPQQWRKKAIPWSILTSPVSRLSISRHCHSFSSLSPLARRSFGPHVTNTGKPSRVRLWGEGMGAEHAMPKTNRDTSLPFGGQFHRRPGPPSNQPYGTGVRKTRGACIPEGGGAAAAAEAAATAGLGFLFGKNTPPLRGAAYPTQPACSLVGMPCEDGRGFSWHVLVCSELHHGVLAGSVGRL